MVKEEVMRIYVTSDGKKFFDLLDALNHENGYNPDDLGVIADKCQHSVTATKKIAIQITRSQGLVDYREVTVCMGCEKFLGF